MKTVFYFGDTYYWESGTMMGQLYTYNGDRYDWGKLQNDVSSGVEVLVKPATKEMLAWANNKLKTHSKNKVKLSLVSKE